ncbi:MAG TPA: DUF4252 domain-containing protein [Terracidiphilus sp.]|nr:DUF4252 domain-containing protein [Terracidiphilus sp.]
MRILLRLAGIPALSALLLCVAASAQTATPQPAPSTPPPAATADQGPVDLDYVPPALHQLSTQAAFKNSFTFDHNMLEAASNLLSSNDADLKRTVAKIDGVSIHILGFGQSGVPDETAVDSIRQAYHLRGWKHLVSTTGSGGPIHDNVTDVWIVLDGATVRGGVVLAETPKSVTLVTVAGNISPADILRLRGKFGIPNFNAGDFKDAK